MKSFIIHDCFGVLTNSLMYGSQIQRGTPGVFAVREPVVTLLAVLLDLGPALAGNASRKRGVSTPSFTAPPGRNAFASVPFSRKIAGIVLLPAAPEAVPHRDGAHRVLRAAVRALEQEL